MGIAGRTLPNPAQPSQIEIVSVEQPPPPPPPPAPGPGAPLSVQDVPLGSSGADCRLSRVNGYTGWSGCGLVLRAAVLQGGVGCGGYNLGWEAHPTLCSAKTGFPQVRIPSSF